MKKTLLFLTSCALFASVNMNAQKVWNFSTWGANATAYSANTDTINDNLGIYPGNTTTFGVIDASSKTLASDGTAATLRFKYGGASFVSTDPVPNIFPSQRFLYFKVTGPCTITVDYMSSSSGAATTINLTDGTSSLPVTAGAASGGQSAPAYATFNYTGTGGRIYVTANYSQACNLYKISVSANVGTTTLSTNDVTNKSNPSIFYTGEFVNVTNIKSNTAVNVYSTTGQLVKSFSTKTDTSFGLKPGIYIVNAKSDKGEKSQKVIVK